MKKTYIALLLLFVFSAVKAQTQYKTITSDILNEDRQIKVQLPRGYKTNTDKSYPLVVVLDGDYLFEVVAGNVDYYSYWEDMPEAIVVGVNQFESRADDCNYSANTSLPLDSGSRFYDFISNELLSFVKKSYRTLDFKVVVGHGETANYINYFMLKEDPLFQSYIVLSPDLAPKMNAYVFDKLLGVQSKLFYFLATSNNDVKKIAEKTKNLDSKITTISNQNVLYNFKNYEEPSHYALPAHAIPDALEKTFLIFQPISKKEYQETILKLTDSPVTYLLDKYKTIDDLFGIEKTISINDFKAIYAAIAKQGKWEYLEALGKVARKEYPDSLLGHYYLGRFYEETGEPKKAMKTYQSAYILEEIAGITKDFVLDRADNIKADFGY